LYAVADWDYNETYINKTQNFKIRYGGQIAQPVVKYIFWP